MHHHFVCSMSVFNKDIKDHDCLCFIGLEILLLFIFVKKPIALHDQELSCNCKKYVLYILYIINAMSQVGLCVCVCFMVESC